MDPKQLICSDPTSSPSHAYGVFPGTADRNIIFVNVCTDDRTRWSSIHVGLWYLCFLLRLDSSVLLVIWSRQSPVCLPIFIILFFPLFMLQRAFPIQYANTQPAFTPSSLRDPKFEWTANEKEVKMKSSQAVFVWLWCGHSKLLKGWGHGLQIVIYLLFSL